MNVEQTIRRQFEQGEVWSCASLPEEIRAVVSAKLVPREARSVLDVGCGDGRVTNLMTGHGRLVVGCDISKTALVGVNTYRVHASIDNLPFADRSFDAVTAFEVLEHLPDDLLRRVLNEIKRIARRSVVISVPYRERHWSQMVRCASCGHVYNCYGHVQSFDVRRMHRLLHPEFRLDHQIFLSIKGYHFGAAPNWLWWLAKRAGATWSALGHAYCPKCGTNKKTSSSGNLFGFVLVRLIWRLEEKQSLLPAWMMATYTRNV